MEEFDLFSWSWYNQTDNVASLVDPILDNLATNESEFTESEVDEANEVRVFIETIAFQSGTFNMRWLEVTKPFLKTQTGKTMRNINCKVECPEINACISDELVCDGISHCPSSYDENPEFCNKFPTLYVVSSGVILAFCVSLLLVVLVVYRLNCKRSQSLSQSDQSSNNGQYNQQGLDYVDYPEYPRLGSELNFRSLQDCHRIQYTENGMPLEITRSLVPHYHNNVF